MAELIKDIDFSDENPRLAKFLEQAAKEIAKDIPDRPEYKKPALNTDFSNYVVVLGLPIAEGDKIKTLGEILVKKVLGSLELVEHFRDLVFGYDNSNTKTNGTALIGFDSADSARLAANGLHNLALDKKHTFKAYILGEFDEIIGSESKFTPPVLLSRQELHGWFDDAQRRDMFLMRLGETQVQLKWFENLENRIDDAAPTVTADEPIKSVVWSVHGTFAVTLHKSGFRIWGGSRFECLSYCRHPEVRCIEFSNDENYILSFNGTNVEVNNSENYIIWNRASAERLRVFRADATHTWGKFKFSADSKYIARVTEELLSVYELPAVSLIVDTATGKKAAMKIPNLKEISWSPKENLLLCPAFLTQKEREKVSAGGHPPKPKFHVLEIPSRNERKWKTITQDIESLDLRWEQHGNYVLAFTKKVKGKKFYTSIQLANFKKKEQTYFDRDFDDLADGIYLDQANKRVAVSTIKTLSDETSFMRYNHAFFRVEEDDKNNVELKECGTLINRHGNEVIWSPNGQFFIVVNLTEAAIRGYMEFGVIRAVQGVTPAVYTAEIIKTIQYPYLTTVSYDPSGRFVSCFSAQNQVLTIFHNYGVQYIKESIKGLQQFEWRSRPNIVLDQRIENEVNTGYKNYSKKYEEFDDKVLNKTKYERERLQQQQREEFLAFLTQKRRTWEESRPERVKIRGFDEDNLSDVTFDELIVDEVDIDAREIVPGANPSPDKAGKK
eukprot:TRINITY_DN3330_c0_g2_i1.p1 TRINITY_DN3330_c0_g2~~TRINITY_DN3330_c0_g2_i1.p1  ORF type:complete len:725 (-),score=234.41 TRINITY_DN3330_c0_g2_i1:98-2272(-)